MVSAPAKPARKLLKPSHANRVGAIHAPWLQPDGIHHESEPERSCILLMLLAPGVQRIQHQPRSLQVNIEKRHTYVPDFLATLCNRASELIEVRPTKFVEKDVALFNRAAEVSAEQGAAFYVCTDKELSTERVEVAMFCHFNAKLDAPAAELDRLLNAVAAAGRLQIDQALADGITDSVIAHAVGKRLLTAGPDINLSPEGWLTLMESQHDTDELSVGAWLGCAPWGAHV